MSSSTERIRGLSIKRKLRLIVAASSGLSLCIACAGFLSYELANFRGQTLDRVTSVAEVVARNSRAAVSFLDAEAAERTLEALSVEQEVSLACIFDGEQAPLASYQPESEARAVPGCLFVRPAATGHAFADGALRVRVPIVLDGEEIGSLFVRYEMTEAADRALRYAAIVAAVFLGSLIVVVMLSEWLQGMISRPVDHLVAVAGRVSDHDYTVRAEQHADDELGLLIESFNEMVAKIQDHDRELEHHRDTLEQQVDERTRTLAAQNESLRQEIQGRRRAESALRKSEQDIRMLMDQASDGIAILSDKGRIVAMNPAGCAMLGYAPNAILGLAFSDLLPPEEEASPQELERLRSGGVLLQERRLQRRDHSFVWTETSMKALDDGRLQAIIRDVTERKELEEQLRHSQKMEAVGQLAAGVAHEINNPMAFVRSNLSVLRKEWDGFARNFAALEADGDVRREFDECAELIDDSLEGVDRVVRIVRDVKEFTHHGEHERTMVDLHEVLDGVIRLAAPHLGPNTVIERAYGEIPLVPCVVDQVRQVFLNLLVNANHAVGDAGRIRIVTGADSSAVTVAVEDDGCGIPPEVGARLFDPFFTTKPVGQGTGLGLAISYDIVRRHGGAIVFESEPGQGTVFQVVLPTDEA